MSAGMQSRAFGPLALAVLLGCTALCAVANAAELRPMALRNWIGGSYTDNTTRKFSYCSVTASYRSGINLLVAMDRDWGWKLGFYNPNWKLQAGSQVPVQVSFDGRAPYAGTANVATGQLVVLPMAPTSQLLSDFRKGSAMVVQAGGMNFPFALTTTSKVMVALAGCVKAELAYEQGGPVPDLGLIVASLSPAAPPSRPRLLNPSPVTPAPVAAASTVSTDDTLIATQIASNLLLQAKLPNARILAADETPENLKGFGVAWASDAGSGAVKIVDVPPGQTGQDIASQLIAADASTCKGDFASGRSSDLVDSSIVTKAFVACKQSSGLRSARYLIYQGGPTHFIVFDTVAPQADERPPSEAPPTESRFQAAALRAVSYETWK
jgi:hypothetical protein